MKINKFITLFCERLLFVQDVTLFFVVHWLTSRYNAINFSVTIIIWQLFFWRNSEYMSMYWTVQFPEILKLCPWKLEYVENEWMNIEQSFGLCCLHWYTFTCIPIQWHHEKVVRQKTSLQHCTIVLSSVWWYNILCQTGHFL